MRATALLDNRAELLELALGAQKRAETLLRELARLLVLYKVLGKYHGGRSATRTLEFLNNSITRLSYGENPATSRMTERTN